MDSLHDAVRAAGLESDSDDAMEPTAQPEMGSPPAAGEADLADLGLSLESSEEEGGNDRSSLPQNTQRHHTPDDNDPAAAAFQKAGLEDSGSESAGNRQPDDFDEFAVTTDETVQPKAIQRPVGKAEEWAIPLVPTTTTRAHLANFKGNFDIEPNPYDAEKFTLDEPVEFDDTGTRIYRAPVLNRLRWRIKSFMDNESEDCALESNARFVRWSDGSLSLFVGSECVDVVEERMRERQVLLGVLHEESSLIQGQGLVETRLQIRPPPVGSQLHENSKFATSSPLKPSMQTVQKSEVLIDYEHDHNQAVDRDYQELNLKNKQEKKGRGRAGSKRSLGMVPQQRLNASFLEGPAHDTDDEYDGQRPSSMRSRGREGDAELRDEQRLLQLKKRGQAVSKRGRGVLGDDADVELSEDDDSPAPAPTKKANMRATVLDDSDDDF